MNSIPTPINPLSAGDKLFKAGLAKLRMSREVPKLREESDNRKGIPCAGKSPLMDKQLMDIVKARKRTPKQIIDDVNSGKIKLEDYQGHKKGNNTRKSNYGEMNTDLHFEKIDKLNGKAVKLKPLHEKVTDIDSPIKHGIDHVYECSSPPPKYVIVESKYGSSKLSTLSDGETKQMSETWIKGNKRLENAVGDKARDIEKALNRGEVDKVLSKVDKTGNVTTKKLDNLGNIIGDWP
ncbi:hypothetical protein [Treponema pedis]|uniref:hypothetical protein n=1 Tax=Treponema pedis TaxID=409322 RepID=UPI003D1E463E